MLVSHGAVPLPDALFEDHGQLVESQAEEFGHPAGPRAGFLGGVNEDAICFSRWDISDGKLAPPLG